MENDIISGKIVTTVIILLLLSVLSSGCIGENNIAPAPDPTQKEAVNASSKITLPSKEENIPEISIVSFSSIYGHSNLDNNSQASYNISRVYYVVYYISIKNNSSTTLDFKLNDLRLHEGDKIFNAIQGERIFNNTLEPYWLASPMEVLRDIEKENKLQDTILLPGRSLNGAVAFRVNSLYNESFLLMYSTTSITSASFEKSLESLKTAEHFNYSAAFGVPPYNCNERSGMKGSYEPKFDDYYIWANWVNRSIFETFQKSDVERMRKSPSENIPMTELIYALRVFPEKNISMFPKKTESYFITPLVIDDTGEEMINKSREIAGLAVLSNRTYTLFKYGEKLNMTRMNFSSASVVQISFDATYGWSMASRLSFVNQIIILDDKLNIIAVSYEPDQFVS